jgi:hypothetical protein
MSAEAEEIQRIVSASVRDMLDAYRTGVRGPRDRQGVLMNTSLEGGTMATYHRLRDHRDSGWKRRRERG